MLEKVLRVGGAFPAARRLVVTGHQHRRVSRLGRVHGFSAVRCRAFADGQAQSLKAGVEAADPAHALLILLGDMPFVPLRLLERMQECFHDPREAADIIANLVDEHPRPPVLFHPRYREELLGLRGDAGARKLIRRHEDRCLFLPWERENPWFRDIDRPEDLWASPGGRPSDK